MDVTSAIEALNANVNVTLTIHPSDSAENVKKKIKDIDKHESTSDTPKKRGRKPKSEKLKEETSESGQAEARSGKAPTPGRERSKRRSAQNASLKLQETSDEDDFFFKKKESKESSSSRKSIEGRCISM